MYINDNRLSLHVKLMLRIVHNAMLLGIHRNKKFLNYLFTKEYLGFCSTLDPIPRHITEFFKLLDLFEAKYKNNYDLGFEDKGTYLTPYFKVLYPDFTITNSAGESHNIKDLVVIHRVAYSRTGGHIYTQHPEGGRFRKTKLETTASYQQSHLPGYDSKCWRENPFQTATFCVGGDTDVSRMIAEFEVEMDWDRYELFLFCVDSMITWESLEGIPYRKMRDIKTSMNNRVTSINNNHILKIVNYIINEEIPLDVDFYVSEGRFKIKPNERANEFIKKAILYNLPFEAYKFILVTRVSNTFSEFLQMRAESQQASDFTILSKDQYTIFRGKKVFAKIIKEDTRNQQVIPLENYIVYPNFLKDVLSQLESRIYSKAIIKSGIKIYNSFNNASRSITSDTISM